jgi:hypothetical protein
MAPIMPTRDQGDWKRTAAARMLKAVTLSIRRFNLMFSRRMIVVLVLVMGLSSMLSACNWNATRNADGSWTVTANMDETDAQQAINMALDDPLIKSIQVDFQPGVIAVTADRQSVDGARTDVITFNVMLSVVDGHLGAVVSEAMTNGRPMEASVVSVWNQRIANRLENAGQRRPNSTLQSVTVTDSGLTMVWNAQGRK